MLVERHGRAGTSPSSALTVADDWLVAKDGGMRGTFLIDLIGPSLQCRRSLVAPTTFAFLSDSKRHFSHVTDRLIIYDHGISSGEIVKGGICEFDHLLYRLYLGKLDVPLMTHILSADF